MTLAFRLRWLLEYFQTRNKESCVGFPPVHLHYRYVMLSCFQLLATLLGFLCHVSYSRSGFLLVHHRQLPLPNGNLNAGLLSSTGPWLSFHLHRYTWYIYCTSHMPIWCIQHFLWARFTATQSEISKMQQAQRFHRKWITGKFRIYVSYLLHLTWTRLGWCKDKSPKTCLQE